MNFDGDGLTNYVIPKIKQVKDNLISAKSHISGIVIPSDYSGTFKTSCLKSIENASRSLQTNQDAIQKNVRDFEQVEQRNRQMASKIQVTGANPAQWTGATLASTQSSVVYSVATGDEFGDILNESENNNVSRIIDQKDVEGIIKSQVEFSIGDYGKIITKENGNKVVDIALKDIQNILFENPILGASGMANCDVNLRSNVDSSSNIIRKLDAGTRFTYLEEAGDYVKVAVNGDKNDVGYVYKQYCLINLPDVIRSVRYQDPNNDKAVFKSGDYDLEGITNQKLGDAKNYDKRIGETTDEIMSSFGAAKNLQLMSNNAMLNGYVLTVVNGFRPREIQNNVKDALQNAYNTNANVKAGIEEGGWSVSWFIATGDKGSQHQYGGAFDFEVSKMDGGTIQKANGIEVFVPKEDSNYKKDTLSAIHDLSAKGVIMNDPVSSSTLDEKVYSIRNNEDSKIAYNSESFIDSLYNDKTKSSDEAMKIIEFGFDSGFSPLASEWWHLNALLVEDDGNVTDYRTKLNNMSGAGGKFKADGISELSSSVQDALQYYGDEVSQESLKDYKDVIGQERFNK